MTAAGGPNVTHVQVGVGGVGGPVGGNDPAGGNGPMTGATMSAGVGPAVPIGDRSPVGLALAAARLMTALGLGPGDVLRFEGVDETLAYDADLTLHLAHLDQAEAIASAIGTDIAQEDFTTRSGAGTRHTFRGTWERALSVGFVVTTAKRAAQADAEPAAPVDEATS